MLPTEVVNHERLRLHCIETQVAQEQLLNFPKCLLFRDEATHAGFAAVADIERIENEGYSRIVGHEIHLP